MKKLFLPFLAATLFCGNVLASGYQVLLQSNRSTAMGNVGVGLRPDPSSLNFNPGSLAMMRQNGIQIGANVIYSKVAFQPFGSNDTYNTENDPGTPFHLFAAWGPEGSKFKFGLGVYTPFGSSVEWEDKWVGRFDLTSLSLRAIYVQPTVSYKLNDKLSVGAGFIYSFGGVNLQRDIRDMYFGGDEYGSAELDGDASGFGYNLGIYFTPTEKLSLGLAYRSRIDMKVEDGTASFRKSPAITTIPDETGFTSELPLPSTLTLGVAYHPSDKLTLGVDIARTGWSAYEALTFTYDEPINGQTETSARRDYESSYTFRFGAEYGVNEMIMLRAGAYYDQTPVQEGYMTPETPDANTIGISGGVGLKFNNFGLDASFLFIDKEQRDNPAVEAAGNNLTGTYKTYAFIPGVTLSYNF